MQFDQLKRREFITLIGSAAAAWPLAASAQQGERVRRIGVLMDSAADEPEAQARLAALLQGLQEAGWAVGRNVRIDTRWSAGDAAELVALGLDVIVAGTGPTLFATGDSHRAYRVCPKPRSGGRRLCAEPGASSRQHDRIYPV
jgi:hypothetical protein